MAEYRYSFTNYWGNEQQGTVYAVNLKQACFYVKQWFRINNKPLEDFKVEKV